jgi:hypothetical protein
VTKLAVDVAQTCRRTTQGRGAASERLSCSSAQSIDPIIDVTGFLQPFISEGWVNPPLETGIYVSRRRGVPRTTYPDLLVAQAKVEFAWVYANS